MPTLYASTDSELYRSKYDINSSFDDILGRIMYVDFSTYGFQTLESSSDKPVNLNEIIENNNYKIEWYINGPDGVTHSPLIVTVSTDGENNIYQCIIHMLDVHYRVGVINQGGVANWSDWMTSFNSTCPISSGVIEPLKPTTSFAIWIDTSVPGFPVIKGYQPSLGWFGIGSLIDTMNTSVYDVENKFTDAFLYLEAKLGMIKFNIDGTYEIIPQDAEKVTAYNFRYQYHKHLDLGHLSIQERKYFESLISIEDFDKALDQYQKEFIEYANERISGKIPGIKKDIEGNYDRLKAHKNNNNAHVTLENKHYWNLKAEPDHTHYSDFNVQIDASDIVSGIIDPKVLPSTLVERMVRVKTHEDRFELDTFDVQNGDSVFVDEETDEFEAGLYLVLNMYQLDKPESYLHYRTEYYANMDYEDIGHMPNTFEGYGIEDTAPAVKDKNMLPNGTFNEFIYPYKEEDGSFNKLLYDKVTAFYTKYELVLYNIEQMIYFYDVYPIHHFIEWNLEKLGIVSGKWGPYGAMSGIQIVPQHKENISTHSKIETIYNQMCAHMY